jgi:hypothetical protein
MTPRLSSAQTAWVAAVALASLALTGSALADSSKPLPDAVSVSMASTITAETLLPVDGLTSAGVKAILRDYEKDYAENQPDIALFGQNHCRTQSMPILRMINARGNFGAVYFEDTPGTQSSIDSIMNWSVKTNLSTKQMQLLSEFETKTGNLISESAISGCKIKTIRDANAAEEIALAKDLAVQHRKLVLDDYNAATTDKFQAILDATLTPEARRQFDLSTHNEKNLARN